MRKGLILLLLGLTSVVFAAGGGNPNSGKECAICHYEWNDEFLYDFKSTALVPYQKERVVASERICFSCHDGTVIDSRRRVWSENMHKTNVKIPAGMQVPDMLPLDNGTVQCRTCHTAHGTGDPAKQGMNQSVFLRVMNGDSELCILCHGDNSGGKNHPFAVMKRKPAKGFEDTHTQLGTKGQVTCQSCHTPHGAGGETLRVNDSSASDLCLNCHQEKVNSATFNSYLAHPVERTAPEKGVKFLQQKGSRFDDGKVVCLTCHTPHKSKTNGLLVQSNNGDQLCLECHDDKRKVYRNGHNLKKIKGFFNKNGDSPFTHGVCSACHTPHGWALSMKGTGADDALTGACMSCHKRDGVAKKHSIDLKKFQHPIRVVQKTPTSMPLFDNSSMPHRVSVDADNGTVTCASCHDVHSSGKMLLRDTVNTTALCLDCHENKSGIGHTKHGSEDMGCLDCHSVHNASNKTLLKGDSDADACLKCHSETGKGKNKLIGDHSHPYDRTINRALPTPFKTIDGRVSCSSCHDPHRPSKEMIGTGVDFIRGEKSDQDSMCQACHEDKKGISGSDHDFDTEKVGTSCKTCHAVHQAKEAKMLFSKAFEYRSPDDYCLVCHNPEGSGKEKIFHRQGHPTGLIKGNIENTSYLTDTKDGKAIYCHNCHDPHNHGPEKGAEGGFKNSFLRSLNSPSFCAACHTDKVSLTGGKHDVQQFKDKSSLTQKLNNENNTCGVCHQVHESGRFLMVDEKPDNWCISCHTDDGLGEKKPIYRGHPTGIKQAVASGVHPLDKGTVACYSCHDPHTRHPEFLRSDKGNSAEMCLDCHTDKSPVLLSDHHMKLYEGTGEKGRHECESCHQVHNGPEGMNALWPEKLDGKGGFIENACLSCHTEDRVGAEKQVPRYGHPEIPVTYTYNSIMARLFYLKDGERDMKGFITCTTCHDPHVWTENKPKPIVAANREGNAKNSFLMFKDVVGMCSACHGLEGLTRYKYYHTEKYRKPLDTEEKKGFDFKRFILGD